VLALSAPGVLVSAEQQTSAKEDLSLVAFWRFDEGEGDILADSSGYGNHARLVGGRWVKGVSGYAVSLDGRQDFIRVCGDSSLTLADEITLEGWIRSRGKTKPDPHQYVAESMAGRYNHGWVLNLTPDMRLVAYAANGKQVWQLASKAPLKEDEWYHFAFTFKSNEAMCLFVNGELNGKRADVGEFPGNRAPNIGCWRPSPAYFHGFNGAMDELRLYDRALTASEVSEHYAAPDKSSRIGLKVQVPRLQAADMERLLEEEPPAVKGIPPSWQYQRICGKRFWLDISYQPLIWLKAGMADESWVIESAIRPGWIVLRPDSPGYKRLLSLPNRIVLWRGGLWAAHTTKAFVRFKRDFGQRYIGTFGSGVHEWTWMCDPPKVWERLTKQFSRPMPKTKREAQDLLWMRVMKYIKKYTPGQKVFVITATLQDHFVNSFDEVAISFPEIGTRRVYPAPIQLIFARGAARQYGKPCGVYIAAWHVGVTTYNVLRPCCQRGFHGPWCGTALSRQKRMLYLSYMAGANIIHHESDQPGDRENIFVANYDFRTVNEIDPLVLLLRDRRLYPSPLAAIYKEFYDCIVKKHDRGVPFTPVALLFDQYHGYTLTAYGATADKLFAIIPCKDGDYMVRAVVNTLYPWESVAPGETFESQAMPPNPLTGDIFDALSNTASLDTLKSYEVVFLIGDVEMDKAFAQHLAAYVKDGGTLVINTQQLRGSFAECLLGCRILEAQKRCRTFCSHMDESRFIEEKEFPFRHVVPTSAKVLVETADSGRAMPLVTQNQYGAGKVILTTPTYLYLPDSKNKMLKLFSHLIIHLARNVMPVWVEGDVEWLVNKNANGWVVTLINNHGVYKTPGRDEVIKPQERREVKIQVPQRTRIRSASEWLTGRTCSVEPEGVKVVVPAGDIRIVELQTEGGSK